MIKFDTVRFLSDKEFEMRKNLKTKELEDKLAVISKQAKKMAEN